MSIVNFRILIIAAIATIVLFPNFAVCENPGAAKEMMKVVNEIAELFPGKIVLGSDSSNISNFEIGYLGLNTEETYSLLEKCAQAEFGGESFRINAFNATASPRKDSQDNVLLAGTLFLHPVKEKAIKPEEHFICSLFSSVKKIGGFNPAVQKDKPAQSGVNGWFSNLKIEQDGTGSVVGFALGWPQVVEIATALASQSSKTMLTITEGFRNTFERVPVVRFGFNIQNITTEGGVFVATGDILKRMHTLFEKIESADLRLMDLRLSPPQKRGKNKISLLVEFGFTAIDDRIPLWGKIFSENAVKFDSLSISASAETDPSSNKVLLSSMLLGMIYFPDSASDSAQEFPTEALSTLFTYGTFNPGITKQSGVDPSIGVWLTNLHIDTVGKIALSGYAQTPNSLKSFGQALKKSGFFPTLKLDKPNKVQFSGVAVGQFNITGNMK